MQEMYMLILVRVTMDKIDRYMLNSYMSPTRNQHKLIKYYTKIKVVV